MFNHQSQFQHYNSIPEFQSLFGTEAKCAVPLHRSRWPFVVSRIKSYTGKTDLWFPGAILKQVSRVLLLTLKYGD
jgi:hypothetical protein